MGASWGADGFLIRWDYLERSVWRSQDGRFEVRRGAIADRTPGFLLFEHEGSELVQVATRRTMREIVYVANERARRPLHNVPPELLASRPGVGITDGSP